MDECEPLAHGGGKRCSNAECDKMDAGRGFCVSHGGGKRCQAGAYTHPLFGST